MPRLALPALLPLLALAGCGGEKDASRPTSTAPATTTATTSETTSPSPRDMLRAVQTSVRGAESFHIEGGLTDEEGLTQLKGDVAADGAVRLELRQKGTVVDMIVIGEESVYLRGDEAFWEQSNATETVQQLLAGQWVKAPADDEAAELAEQLQPEVVADCLDESVGKLSAREDTLDGADVVILVDEGDKPGTAPGELYVAAEDEPLPVRIRQTGARRAGGPPVDPKCGSDEDESPKDRSDLRLSRWNEPVEIVAPPGALDLEDIAGQADEEPAV